MIFTQKQALTEIFENNTKPLSSTLLVQKHRLKKGLLSQKVIDQILKENGFVIKQETLYTRI